VIDKTSFPLVRLPEAGSAPAGQLTVKGLRLRKFIKHAIAGQDDSEHIVMKLLPGKNVPHRRTSCWNS